MQIFEKLGLFYIGKEYDPRAKELTESLVLYDSKDLVTHGVCVGMTGSGKTGLCISLLEEAAIDNIPAIIIDPKGDLGNLLLTFPELEGEDFLPWVNPDEAHKKELSLEVYADQQANLWKNGLADWGQDSERIRRFKSSVDMAIYTPGSNAGLPVSIIKSFSAPSQRAIQDLDLLRERIQTTTSGILELLGIRTDPLQSREHILISNIFEYAWLSGQNLDLGSLIQMIQSPPIQKIGVFDLESFYPSAERYKLSITLNNLLAAPGFKTWMEGEPLDISQLLYTETGKPRMLIFSIAHLSEAERMFFVTLLLNQVLGWTRTQSGTTSLRAILYMDEVFGFLPPVAEPPSKRPLLTLLKQARAYGLGVTLATQNPVDLDYKALSNIGTWFIGRLQTERDKERLVDGLTSAMVSQNGLTQQELMDIISGLEKRHFLLHNVHDKRPRIFKTRWVLSYLCGPLTRNQISKLMEEYKTLRPVASPGTSAGYKPNVVSPSLTKPQLPPEITQYYAPLNRQIPSQEVNYLPYLLAGGDVQIFNNRYGIAQTDQIAHVLALDKESNDLSWENAQEFVLLPDILNGEPLERASYSSLPPSLTRLSVYRNLDKQYESYIYRNYQLVLLKSNLLKMISHADETERDFRVRMQQIMHEKRDVEIERLKRRYASKFSTLQRQILTAQNRVESETEQYKQKKMDAAISFGTTLLGTFFGGRRSASGVGRAARSATRLSRDKQDIDRAQKRLNQLQDQFRVLETELEEQTEKIVAKFDPMIEQLQQIVIKPQKSDILQKFYGILWIPYKTHGEGDLEVLTNGFNF